MSALLLLLLALPASAELPLPGLDQSLVRAKWYEINAQIERACGVDLQSQQMRCTDEVQRAIDAAQAFQRAVLPDASIEYLAGLATKLSGDDRGAQRHYRRALQLDPQLTEAWYDLGEILLAEGRYPEADEAFAQVTAQIQRGPRAWLGPWRQGEIAAHQRQIQPFEAHMREALRRGFSFEEVRGLPNWRAFYADPALRDSIDKLVTVYGNRSVLDSLQPSEPPP